MSFGRSARPQKRGARRAVVTIFFWSCRQHWRRLVGNPKKRISTTIPNAWATVDHVCNHGYFAIPTA